ncbi:hypothetical protein [uncultured Aquimarina sp.]|uniref:hypothetical protein n=1 Tax=uncultured Aquimarina sp. TaxID=575652 RepID=UPI00263158FC|nr:hypothetical protein [uncultured Aquimarina sp.]
MLISDDFLIVTAFISFIAAAVLRLMDNSGSILLKNSIYIESSYVSRSLLKKYIFNENGIGFKKSLKRVLVIRSIHNFCLLVSIMSIVWVIIRNILFE